MRAILQTIKNKYNAIIESFGTSISTAFISPFGLYSKPKAGCRMLYFNQDRIVIPLQDYKKVTVELSDDEVIITDGLSYFHLKNDGTIDLKSKTVNITADVNIVGDTVFKGDVDIKGDIDMTGGVKSNGKNISDTHTHGGVMSGAMLTSTVT